MPTCVAESLMLPDRLMFGESLGDSIPVWGRGVGGRLVDEAAIQPHKPINMNARNQIRCTSLSTSRRCDSKGGRKDKTFFSDPRF